MSSDISEQQPALPMTCMNYHLKKQPEGIEKRQWLQKEETYLETQMAQQRRMEVAAVKGPLTCQRTRYMP
jgi:hypothetical protein